jgi:hypothetical protein
MPSALWTIEERADFVRRNYGKMPIKKIAAALGVSYVAIIKRARRLGMPALKYRVSAERACAIPALVSSGMTNAQIAAHLGCHERTVTWHIKRLGCQRRRPANVVTVEQAIYKVPQREGPPEEPPRIPIYILMRPCYDPPGSPRRLEIERQREEAGLMNNVGDAT